MFATPAAAEVLSFRAKLGMLLFMTTLFFIGYMSRVILGPMLPTVESDLGINHLRSGSLLFGFFLGMSAGALGSGLLNSRIGHRNSIIVSYLLPGLGLTAASMTGSLLQLGVALFFVGIGGGLYIPSSMVTITSLVSQKNWGKAISIHEMAPNLAFVLTPIITEILLRFITWRSVLLFLGLATITAGAIYALIGPGGKIKGERPRLAALVRVARLPSLWLLILQFALALGGSIAVYNMMSLYLVNEHHWTRESTNTILAVSRITGLFITFASGYVSDRLGPRLAIRMVLLLTGAFTILIGLVSGWVLIAVIILQGATVASYFPTGFAALARVSAPEERTLALSLNTPVATVLGAGLFSAVIGYMGDNSTFAAGFTTTGILILLGSFTVHWLRFHDENR